MEHSPTLPEWALQWYDACPPDPTPVPTPDHAEDCPWMDCDRACTCDDAQAKPEAPKQRGRSEGESL